MLTEKKFFCKNLFISLCFSTWIFSPVFGTPAPGASTTVDGVWQYAPQTGNRQALYYYGLGLRLYRTAKMKDAVVQFDQAIKLDPKCAEFYFKRGDALLELDKLTEAYQDFSKAIQLEPGHYPAYKRRARLEYERGKYDAALRDYQSAVRVCTSRVEKADILKFVGKIHSSMNKHDLAIEDLTRSISVDRNAHTLMLRGNQYFAVGQYKKAAADYTEALSHNSPKFQDRLYTMRADAYEKIGRFDLAKIDRKKSKEIVDDSWGGVLEDMDKQAKR